MFVISTAGHVDHGKSTLVKALTGQEPDRWQEEKERGLTIDLGFVWTQLPSGHNVSFVDVPGHERFLDNMLAGVGPAEMVLFIVAGDEGWQAQSSDHRDAINAFGIEHGIFAMTRVDRADMNSPDRRQEVRTQIALETAGTAMENWPIIEVSAMTGEGLEELSHALDELTLRAPAHEDTGRIRLWLDRAFSIKGAGTVVTGTLTSGTIAAEDSLVTDAGTPVSVRGIQSQEQQMESISPANRVALNLRGVTADELSRGDVLLTPEAWPLVSVMDVRRVTGAEFSSPPREVVAHIGTASVGAALRRFNPTHLRLHLETPLPLSIGDRVVLRKPGDRHVYAGVTVVDVDPPELGRRGDSARRAEQLEKLPSVAEEVIRRGAMKKEQLIRFGYQLPDARPPGIVEFSGWWVHAPALMKWKERLEEAVDKQDFLAAGLSRGAAIAASQAPAELLPLVVAAAKMEQADGVVRRPGAQVELSENFQALEKRLQADPFDAPETHELEVETKELAAAQRAGRILRLSGGVVLLPSVVAEAKKRLAELEQPFTTSQARQAFGTTRRVAIPLLEHLDSIGVTRRVDGTMRQLR